MIEHEENLHPDAKGVYVVFQNGPPATPPTSETPTTPAVSEIPQSPTLEDLEMASGDRAAGAATTLFNGSTLA